MKPFSDAELKKLYEQNLSTLCDVVDRFPWENKECYRMWLAQTYYLVRHTTRFLCLSAGRVPVEQRDMHYSFIEHLRQESNHDLALVKDMKVLDSNFQQFEELPETRLVRNNQYHWIMAGGNYALLGYSLLLEGLAAKRAPDIVRQLERAGLGGATAFLKLHGEVDQEHWVHGLESLKECPHEERANVIANLEETLLVYVGMYEKIPKAVSARVKRAA